MKDMEPGIILTAVGIIALLLIPRKANSNPTNNSGSTSSSGSQTTVLSAAQIAFSNMEAFLKTIQYAEGTFFENDPYRVTYAYSHIIQNLSDHPAITGEWAGEILPEQFCINAGINPPCRSTAAGAYQMIKPTWNSLKNSLGLSDFSSYSQDRAADELLRQIGARQLVQDGFFEQAVYVASSQWASFPGSTAGQGGKSMAELSDFYKSQGGFFNYEIV